VLVTRAAHGQEGDGGRGGMRVFTQLLYLCQSCFRRAPIPRTKRVALSILSKRQSFKAKSVVLLVGDVGRLVTLSNGR
jgi:hypothetical protein